MKSLTLSLALILTTLFFLTTFTFTSSQYLPKQYMIATNKARKAAKVPLVKWNATLAIYATRVAKGCGHKPRIPKYALNIFVGSINITATGCVSTWAGQSRCFNPKTRRCRKHCKCGSYRRMIYRQVKYMGCGRQTCSRKRECIVCAYWPFKHRMEVSDVELDNEEFYEEAEFYDGEEEYLSGDVEEGAEEEGINDVEEEEEHLKEAEKAENDTKEQIGEEGVVDEEGTENDSSSRETGKLGALNWLWA